MIDRERIESLIIGAMNELEGARRKLREIGSAPGEPIGAWECSVAADSVWKALENARSALAVVRRQ